jgi:hypothetical protein
MRTRLLQPCNAHTVRVRILYGGYHDPSASLAQMMDGVRITMWIRSEMKTVSDILTGGGAGTSKFKLLGEQSNTLLWPSESLDHQR